MVEPRPKQLVARRLSEDPVTERGQVEETGRGTASHAGSCDDRRVVGRLLASQRRLARSDQLRPVGKP